MRQLEREDKQYYYQMNKMECINLASGGYNERKRERERERERERDSSTTWNSPEIY